MYGLNNYTINWEAREKPDSALIKGKFTAESKLDMYHPEEGSLLHKEMLMVIAQVSKAKPENYYIMKQPKHFFPN